MTAIKKSLEEKFSKIVSFLMAESIQNLKTISSGKVPVRSFKIEAISSDLKAISDKNLSEEETEMLLDRILENISELE